MIKRISRDNVFFAFHPHLEPVLHIKQGEAIVMETHDCFEGQLKSENDLLDKWLNCMILLVTIPNKR